jgi:hypothetical protein
MQKIYQLHYKTFFPLKFQFYFCWFTTVLWSLSLSPHNFALPPLAAHIR